MVLGRVRDAVLGDFWRLAASLRLDDKLSAPASFTVLFAVVVDTLARFKQYEEWPFLLYRLCQDFNNDWRLACFDFLHV